MLAFKHLYLHLWLYSHDSQNLIEIVCNTIVSKLYSPEKLTNSANALTNQPSILFVNSKVTHGFDIPQLLQTYDFCHFRKFSFLSIYLRSDLYDKIRNYLYFDYVSLQYIERGCCGVLLECWTMNWEVLGSNLSCSSCAFPLSKIIYPFVKHMDFWVWECLLPLQSPTQIRCWSEYS